MDAYLGAHALGHFTFWISLSLSVSLSPKFGLRPKETKAISLSEIAESKLRIERSLNPKLINSPADSEWT